MLWSRDSGTAEPSVNPSTARESPRLAVISAVGVTITAHMVLPLVSITVSFRALQRRRGTHPQRTPAGVQGEQTNCQGESTLACTHCEFCATACTHPSRPGFMVAIFSRNAASKSVTAAVNAARTRSSTDPPGASAGRCSTKCCIRCVAA